MRTATLARAMQTDPLRLFRAIPFLALVQQVTYQSATMILGTIPAYSLIGDIWVARTTIWNAVTTFEIGKSGDTDWLLTTAEANVTGNLPSGESAAVERIAGQKVVTVDTDVMLTLNQGAASAGNAYVIVEFRELVR